MGNMTGMLLGGCNGACILPMQQFDPGEGLRLIHEERVSKFTGSPTMYIMMLDHPDFPKRDTSSIKASVIGGADVSPDLVRTVMDKMGIKDLINAYGLTENTGVSTMTQPGDTPEIIAYTAGKLIFPDCELAILDPDTGKEVARGTQGEVCSRGFYVMKEYYKQPEETKNAFNKDGWFRTGDLGTMDENGYIKITGRLKDMFMVAMAFVKMKEGETATEEEIIKFARAKMANYKAPKYVKFVNDFPMTLTGKIQKFVLKENAIKELGLGS
jgi:fatty-acyl-CoA synthase